MLASYLCAFRLKQKVCIDGDGGVQGFVTAITFRCSTSPPLYEISYMDDGSARAVWIEEWRLSPAGEQ